MKIKSVIVARELAETPIGDLRQTQFDDDKPTSIEDFANDSIPYMYHCHNLAHEDMGMMRNYEIT